MNIVREHSNVHGIPLPNATRLVITDELPAQELITGAFVLAFEGSRLLLTNLSSRGWDIPGGHIEPGETAVEAMRRELYEETGAFADRYGLLGYEKISLLGDKPDRYRYPYPDSYMVFYWATIRRMDDLPSSDETKGRELFDPELAESIAWIQENKPLYDEALRKAIEAGGEASDI